MKKSLILAGMLCIGYATAQTENYEGRVGINTEAPSATVNIKSKTGSTKDTKNLELENANGTKLLTVLDDGKVGINTTTPSTLLEVINTNVAKNGYNRVAAFLTPDMELGTNSHITLGKSNTKFNSGSIDFVYKEASSNKNGIGFNVYSSGLNTSSDGPYILFAQANGNVGIGTSTPAHRLDVRGNIGIDMPNDRFGFLRYSRTEKARWDVGILNNTEAGENTGSDFYIRGFNDEGTSIHTPFVIKRKTGYIGIGNSPQADANAATERLDIIDGNARIRHLPNNTGVATDKIVVVDNTGVLKSVERSTIASTEVKPTNTEATCSDSNLGAIHFKEVEISGTSPVQKKGVFGFCTKQNNTAMWVYLTNGGNILQGTGKFGDGL